jgi:flagellar motor switch protein FliN/FliY
MNGKPMSDDKQKLDLDDLVSAASEEEEAEIEVAGGEDETLAASILGAASADPVEELGAIYDVPVQLSAVLGKAPMPVSQLLRLGRGAVLELDRKVGESIDILVNNRLVARGEVVIVDERIGVTMTEIIKGDS